MEDALEVQMMEMRSIKEVGKSRDRLRAERRSLRLPSYGAVNF